MANLLAQAGERERLHPSANATNLDQGRLGARLPLARFLRDPSQRLLAPLEKAHEGTAVRWPVLVAAPIFCTSSLWMCAASLPVRTPPHPFNTM